MMICPECKKRNGMLETLRDRIRTLEAENEKLKSLIKRLLPYEHNPHGPKGPAEFYVKHEIYCDLCRLITEIRDAVNASETKDK